MPRDRRSFHGLKHAVDEYQTASFTYVHYKRPSDREFDRKVLLLASKTIEISIRS